MSINITIRDEMCGDENAITNVTISAFKNLDVSHQTEHFIINALRKAKALTLSLVASHDGKIVGHIAFSPVTISEGSKGWFGLGPVSVLPEYQRQGIGTALVKNGLERLKSVKAHGCCLVGHPEYYKRFGFHNCNDFGFAGVSPEVFFALSFNGNVPKGMVTFHEAFLADA